ncbi:glycosyltransferase family 2 protein [bacterium]|nr:glycosyltransferase family 2 protein [bacterium]
MLPISVVIPAKNEAQSIGEVILGVKRYASEIIVVDGHSTDQTRRIAENLGAKIILDNKRGKGDAIRCSIQHLQQAITVFIDADGSHDPEDIPRLIQPLLDDQCDHVGGSRLLGGSSELHGGFDEFFRLTGSSFITACINWKFKVRLSDSQNGFRALKTEVLKKLNLQENSTTIEQEMIVRSLQYGFRVSEVPTHEHARKFGKSHIDLKFACFAYGWSLLKLMLQSQR